MFDWLFMVIGINSIKVREESPASPLVIYDVNSPRSARERTTSRDKSSGREKRRFRRLRSKSLIKIIADKRKAVRGDLAALVLLRLLGDSAENEETIRNWRRFSHGAMPQRPADHENSIFIPSTNAVAHKMKQTK